MIPPLDYYGTTYGMVEIGTPNRLLVLVHPGADWRVGRPSLPVWDSYVMEAAADPNFALLVIERYQPDSIQRDYNQSLREAQCRWKESFGNRFVATNRMLHTPEDREWLMGQLGGPTIRWDDGDISDLLTVSFDGMYTSMCVTHHRMRFPARNVFEKDVWRVDYPLEAYLNQH